RSQLRDTLHRGIEVVDFEPQENAVPVRLVLRVADRPVVMRDPEAMQLKDEPAVRDQSLVLGPAMGAPAAKKALVPPAAGLDVVDRDQGLRAHQDLPPAPAGIRARKSRTRFSRRAAAAAS